MDDTTRKMISTVGATVAKNVLMTVGTSLAAHGILSSGSQVETFTAIGMAAAGALWSFWDSYGRAIVLSQLEVLKAKSLAQAAALDKHDIPAPTPVEIAKQSPTLTAKDVSKSVDLAGKVALFLVAFIGAGVLFSDVSFAQDSGILRGKGTNRLPIDPLGLNEKSGDGLQGLLGALDAKLLPDLQYALKLALASGSKVTAPCYQAWIDIINVRQKAVQDDQNQPVTMPDPHLITDFEKLVELRNSLQPDSDFMVKCSPVASMVKRDIVGFIGVVISGGAGLATLVPGL